MSWRVFAAVLPLLLAGCASLAPPAAVDPQVARQAAAARSFYDTIDLGGRLSVRYQGPYKEEALHGGFEWSQTPAHTAVSLLSPLGQTIALIEVTPQGATLTRGGRTVHAAEGVDALTTESLGWPLPVAGLREWLQGFGVDAAGRRFVATPYTPEVTTPDGWRIRYETWHDGNPPSAQTRPRRIDLARMTAQAGEISIRIVIDSWQTR